MYIKPLKSLDNNLFVILYKISSDTHDSYCKEIIILFFIFIFSSILGKNSSHYEDIILKYFKLMLVLDDWDYNTNIVIHLKMNLIFNYITITKSFNFPVAIQVHENPSY